MESTLKWLSEQELLEADESLELERIKDHSSEVVFLELKPKVSRLKCRTAALKGNPSCPKETDREDWRESPLISKNKESGRTGNQSPDQPVRNHKRKREEMREVEQTRKAAKPLGKTSLHRCWTALARQVSFDRCHLEINHVSHPRFLRKGEGKGEEEGNYISNKDICVSGKHKKQV